jgi:hypothetical protein
VHTKIRRRRCALPLDVRSFEAIGRIIAIARH